jgi:hypothetical protein
MVECSAIDYWARFIAVVRRSDHNVTEFTITEREDPTKRQLINAETVAKAIDDVLNKEYGIAKYIVQYIERAVADLDAGDIDAEAADVLAQVAMFDEVVYG